MAVLSLYLAVTSATTAPISQDEPPNPRRTKVILPKKKPLKWSTGVAPGEYGGPPLSSTKLRKYWGGEEEDPLTSDDFIWNKDFMGRMKRLIHSDPQNSGPFSSPPQKVEDSGFLSLNRVMCLDSLDVDLSKELSMPSKPVSDQQVKPGQSNDNVPRQWKLAPTRREQDKWDRASKATTGGSVVMLQELRRPQGDPQVLAAQSREQYFKLKKKLQILTLGIGGVGLFTTYVLYSPEIAASYGVGLVGSLVYMRMLGSSIDSMADGAKGLVKGAIAQPRLLVPVMLVMIYSRWNEVVVPEYNLMHLELIPMLVGFFTYKISTFTQAIEDALTVATKKT